MLDALAVALLLAVAPPPDPAGTTAAAPDAALPPAVQLARFAMPRGNWEQVMVQLRRQAEHAVLESVAASGKEPPPGFVEMFNGELAAMMKAVMPSYEEALDFQAGLLTKHFTDAELKELIAFYGSPLGQKMIQVQPAVVADVMAWVMLSFKQRAPAAMETVKTHVKDWKAKHGVKPTE